ncbi:hypothetical protein ACLOAV_003854 [Pseudogymnoascus australis]
MGYILSILSILLLTLTIARTFFPSQFFAFAHRPPRLLTYPRVLAFIRRHPRLCAILLNNPNLHHLIHPPPPRPPRPPSLDSSPWAYLPSLHACPDELANLHLSLALDLNTPPTSTLPSRLFCLHCRRLVPYPSLCGPTASPSCRESSTAYQFYGPPSFQHQIFHTAMLLCRRGHDPYPLLNHLKPRSAPTTRHDGGVTSQTAWEYRIIWTSLYQRTRLSMILPRSESNYTLKVQPCPHYASYQRAMDREVELVQDLVRAKPKLRACSDMVSCQKCRTVLRVGCRKFRGLGLGLFVTWWVDLGDGYWAVPKRWERKGWKDVKYTRRWLMDYFEHFCSGQQYFDFEGMDTRADRKELLAIARSIRV